MAQKLMWVCAVAPEGFKKTAVQICLAENETEGLPENVFRAYPKMIRAQLSCIFCVILR